MSDFTFILSICCVFFSAILSSCNSSLNKDVPTTHQNQGPTQEIKAEASKTIVPLEDGEADRIFAIVSTKTDSLINLAIAQSIIPGGVVSISQGGTTIFEKAYGHAMVKNYPDVLLQEPVPMTLDHIFDLASLTKVFATTMAIMLLVDDERIELDKPIRAYLSEFAGPKKDNITIRHLLTHSAGLYPWKPLYYHADSPIDAYEYICELPLAYSVGQDRHYSDLGFMLLGFLVESVSDQSLDRFLDNNLYGPLGLTDTGFKPIIDGKYFAATSHGNPFEKKMVEDDDFGYKCDEDPSAFSGWRQYTLVGEVNDGNAYHAHNGAAGHAGLFSTARDLQVLLTMLLNKGHYNDKRFINQATVEDFLTIDGLGHGLGWAMSADVLPADELPDGAFGHTGFTGTYALALPHANVGLVLLTNRQNMGVDKTGRYPSVTDLKRPITDMVCDLWPSGSNE